MAPIVNAQNISKRFGATPLFQGVSFTVFEGDRIGLIGPNGSGKSTLLHILAGQLGPDSGEVVFRKRLRVSYVAQDSRFGPEDRIRPVIENAMERTGVADSERGTRLAETLGRAGFEDFEAPAAALSGGWQKRLAIVEALAQAPDILLLDEPTNHLDLAGIEWLESVLQDGAFASVVVSHDRYFLENAVTEMAELNRVYPDGLFRVHGNYSAFLEKKEEFHRAQAKRLDALENRVRNEIEWLRRGAKARTSKSKARIDKATGLIGELADLSSRSRTATAAVDFSASGRKTKRLLELDRVSRIMGGHTLFRDLSLTVTAGLRLGLVGPNGSGKTSLLRLLRGEIPPEPGEIRRAEFLRIVYFDQTRQLDPNLTLRRALASDSDAVVYQDRVIHVASWAARFLFSGDQLNQPVGRLSGGERARVLIAQLMLQPADILLLDEPTNDLDIPTLEILEESLLEFQGALVLVTHDRYMLDRVSTLVLGLDGQGNAEFFADYSQWETWLQDRERPGTGIPAGGTAKPPQEPESSPGRKKLSYLESREYSTLEQRIAGAEQTLQAKRDVLEDPSIASNASSLLTAQAEVEKAQKIVDDLYARWSELEAKIS